ncbi:beta strand repeat-containing protein, partial [Flavobacterium psychrotolerans]
TTATNGSTQSTCITTGGAATLSGNTPSVGTGAWTVVSGPSTSSAQFSSTTNPTAVFTPAGGVGSYVLRWTITNGSCASFANATITVSTGSPDGANLQYWSASPGAQQVCLGGNFTAFGQVYKVGVTDGAGQGAGVEAQFGYNTTNNNPNTAGWTWAAATFNQDKSPGKDEYQYTFTPPGAGTYYFTFRYRLGGCTWIYGGYQNNYDVNPSGGFWDGVSFVSGQASVSASAPTAAAGPDISQCNNGTFTMAGNTASPGTGTWTVVSTSGPSPTIVTPGSSTTTVTGIAFGATATLRWTIVNSPCPSTQDDVILTNSSTNTWLGGISTDWNTAGNWCGGVPISGSNVVIPSGTTFSPSIYQTANAVANSVNINTGATLSMSNAYVLSITAAGNFTNAGTFSAGNGTVSFLGAGTIAGATATTFNNVTVAGAVNFGTASTVNGNLTINTGGSVLTNAPFYGSSSTLIYNTGGTYGRNTEWSATSGKGYPNNMTIQNNTILDVVNGSTAYKKIGGNLTIAGTTALLFSELLINNMPAVAPGALGVTGIGVHVLGNIINDGKIVLSGTTTARLTGNNFVNGNSNATAEVLLPAGNPNVGADLEVTGDFTDNAIITSNDRAVFFTGTGIQDVAGTAPGTFNVDYIVVEKTAGSGPVLLNRDLLVGGSQGGIVIKTFSANDIIDLNGHTLTVGTAGVINTMVGNGSFKGNSSSNLIINGVGSIGTIYFDQTTPGTTNVLNNLTLNRTTSGGFSLGSDVNVLGALTLTAGTVNLGSSNMTIGASGSIGVTSPDATKMIIASGTGELRKTYSGVGSFTFPIGDNTATAEYSPVTLNFTAAGAFGGYAGVNVTDAKHPSNASTTDYITRYWSVTTSGITTPTCTASFVYLDADIAGTEASLNGGRYLSSTWNCLDAVTTGTNTISKSVTAFGDFTAGEFDLMGCCVNPTSGGTIATAQSICSGGDPAAFTSTASPTGQYGTLEYKWQSSTTSAGAGFADIALATALTYDAPSGLSQTTWYKRLSRVTCKSTWTGAAESNVLQVTVYNPSTAAVISGTATICPGTSTNLQVAITGGSSPFTVVYNDGTGNHTVNSYTSGSNISVSPSSTTTYTLVSVTSVGGCVGTSNSGSAVVTTGGTTTWNGSTWTNGAPTSTSTVIMAGNYTSSINGGNINACSLTVASGNVIISSGNYVNLSGALTVTSGSFTVENNANLVQSGTTNTNSGNIIVKRNSSSLYLLDYTLWSSPVDVQNLYDFSPNTVANRFYYYDSATNFYTPISAANNFNVGQGYLIRVPRTFSATTPSVYNGVFTGKPNSGTITYAMNAGYNAVGNPYPSQINVWDFVNGNPTISGTLYFWRKRNDPNATSYATLTKLAYVGNAAAGGDTGSSYFDTNTTSASNWVVNVAQGFLVEAASASSLVFNNTMRRSENNGNQFFRNSNAALSDISLYWLNLTNNNGVFNQTAIGYTADATLGVDRGIDGVNINSTNYLCSSIDGNPYSIQGRPEFTLSDIVPLEFKVATAGGYSIAIDHFNGLFTNQGITLKDNLTNTIHDLKAGGYSFTSEAGSFKNRFEIVYQNALAVNQSIFNENNVIAYKQNQDIVINTGKTMMSNVKVYDIRGRLLLSKDNINATQTKLFVGTTQEVLIVKIGSDEAGTVTKKVIN